MSDENPVVLLSAFADEGTIQRGQKSVLEQLAVMAALGFQWYSPRFLDLLLGKGVQHVDSLSKTELATLREINERLGFFTTSIGSRVGKTKLVDVNDGTSNTFMPFDQYCDTVVAPTITAAQALGTKLVRGFSFYHPAGNNVEEHFDLAVERIQAIADLHAAADLIYGIEIEPNLVGETGAMCARLAKAVARENCVLIYDGGNIAAQNKGPDQCMEEFLAMLPYLGWMHIKDYLIDPKLQWEGRVDEERLKNFVPCDAGSVGHQAIFEELRSHLPELTRRVQKLGIPAFFLELEPHLKGGGQFGGFSGPDGMGVALRSLRSLLRCVEIDYEERTMDDITASRGF